MKIARAVAALALVTAPAVVQAQVQGREQSTWTWSGTVGAGRWFRLSNINGAVTVQRSPDARVHVRAEKVLNGGQVREVGFQVVQAGGDVRVCAVWTETDTCDDRGIHSIGRSRRDARRVEARFVVSIPAGVNTDAATVNGAMRLSGVTGQVKVHTVNGSVDVNDVQGPVEAGAVNGSVTVTTARGPVSASSVNGAVRARMVWLTSPGDMRFNTVNGDISVELPSDLDASVDLTTVSGDISSDYPLKLSGRWGPKNARGTIGRGGRELKANTVNGRISLIRRS